MLTERPAVGSDFDFVRGTHHAAYEDVVRRQFGSWDVAEQDRFIDRAWDPGVTTILLTDGEPCGYCVIDDAPDSIQVRELVVHPDHQGAGVGTSVLHRTQERAAESRVPVQLGTFRVNRARVLYERLGFTVYEETPTHFLMEWSSER